jgi:hypothetical protein
MPKKTKSIPVNRADWTFGDAVWWHFFIHGTGPGGSQDSATGAVWAPQKAANALGCSVRTLWNWVDNDPPPYDTTALERVLFGESSHYDQWREELRRLLADARARPKSPQQKPTGRAVAVYTMEYDDRADPDIIDAEFDEIPSPSSENIGNDREKSGEEAKTATVLLRLRQSAERPKASAGRLTFRAVVAGMLVLLGVYLWARWPGGDDKSKKPDTQTVTVEPKPIPSGPRAEPHPPANAEPPKPEPTIPTVSPAPEQPKGPTEQELAAARKAAADAEARRREQEAAQRAEEQAAAERAAAKARQDEADRVEAERLARIQAVKDATDRKRREDEAAARELNQKLKTLAQSEVDTCKQKLEGISVPDFTLKCDTLIPFGALLGAVSVSQTASSLGDCASRCRNVEKCVAFSFDAGAHSGSASCYLTGSIPGYNAAKNWIAGTR